MKIIKWFLDPLINILQNNEYNCLENQKLYLNNKLFRPSTFEEYIGQNKTKEILKNYILGTSSRNKVFPHTLIHGNAGFGKTTLSEILAVELNVKYHSTIGSEIKHLEDIIRKINLVDGGILFIDEIHSMGRDIGELFYTIMEDFQSSSSDLKPFTLVGATTELGELIKNRKPLVDRFKIIIELENYNIEDLVKIGVQYKQKVFPEDTIINNTYKVLAENCRSTPRNLIRLLEATIYFNNINKVLNSFSIIKDGFTIKDLEVLHYLKENIKGVGLNNIASYLNTSSENYVYNIEPYLLQKGLLIRSGRGRKITERGIEKIKELEGSIT